MRLQLSQKAHKLDEKRLEAAHSSLGAYIYRLQILGPKNEARITHFKNPRNSVLDVDVVVMSQHGDVTTSELSMSWIEYDVATLKVF